MNINKIKNDQYSAYYKKYYTCSNDMSFSKVTKFAGTVRKELETVLTINEKISKKFNLNVKDFFIYKEMVKVLIKESYFYLQKKGKLKVMGTVFKDFLKSICFLDIFKVFFDLYGRYNDPINPLMDKDGMSVNYIKLNKKVKVYKNILVFFILKEFFKGSTNPTKKYRKRLYLSYYVYSSNFFVSEVDVKKLENEQTLNKTILEYLK